MQQCSCVLLLHTAFSISMRIHAIVPTTEGTYAISCHHRGHMRVSSPIVYTACGTPQNSWLPAEPNVSTAGVQVLVTGAHAALAPGWGLLPRRGHAVLPSYDPAPKTMPEVSKKREMTALHHAHA